MYFYVLLPSGHIRKTGTRHGIAPVVRQFAGWIHIVVTLFRLGWVIELGLINLVPGNLFARITGKLPHDRDHGAVSHVVAIVDRLTRADRPEEHIMLDLIWIASARPPPVVFAPNLAASNRGSALATEYGTGRIIITTIRRSA